MSRKPMTSHRAIYVVGMALYQSDVWQQRDDELQEAAAIVFGNLKELAIKQFNPSETPTVKADTT